MTEIAEIFPRQGHWREQDYFNLPDTTRIIELVDGELVMPPPATIGHQRIAGDLYSAVRNHVRQHGLGEVFFAPVPVRLAEDRIREPDVLFISHARSEIITHRGIVDGAPDWVAEVQSPSSRRTDQVDKLAEYEEAGVREYWLLDPEARTIRVHVLREGRYTDPHTYTVGDHAQSAAIEGFSVPVEDVL